MERQMSMIIEKIPKTNDEELLVLFHNAGSKLSTELNLAAESVITAVEQEWKKRLERAKAGTYLAARPNDGMLATLGYRVGRVNGEKMPIRRQILKLLFERQLPMVGSPAYTDEWGAPKSSKRYDKLTRFLESQLNNPGNINRPNMEKAMIEWREDLEWVQRTYAHFANEGALLTHQASPENPRTLG
jgi:hypothetical protein